MKHSSGGNAEMAEVEKSKRGNKRKDDAVKYFYLSKRIMQKR